MDEDNSDKPIKDPNFQGPHRSAAKILIGEPGGFIDDPEIPNIRTPITHCRIITTAGEFFAINMSTFQARENVLLELWKVKPSAFTKLDITANGLN